MVRNAACGHRGAVDVVRRHRMHHDRQVVLEGRLVDRIEGAVAEEAVDHRHEHGGDARPRADPPDLLDREVGVERRDDHVEVEARLALEPLLAEQVVERGDEPRRLVRVGPRVDDRRLDRDHHRGRDPVRVEVVRPDEVDVARGQAAVRRDAVLSNRLGEVVCAARRPVVEHRDLVARGADSEPREPVPLRRRQVRIERLDAVVHRGVEVAVDHTEIHRSSSGSLGWSRDCTRRRPGPFIHHRQIVASA